MYALVIRVSIFTLVSFLFASVAFANESEQVSAFKVDLELTDGTGKVMSPSIALMPGAQAEMLSGGDGDGPAYKTVVTVAPLQLAGKSDAAAMVSIAISIVDGEVETAIVNSQVGVRIGEPASIEIEQPGREAGLKLDVEVQHFLVPRNTATSSCDDQQVAAAGAIQNGGCCSVSCGNSGTLRCCGAIWCCDGVCGACCHVP